jgi:hypothetical protein
MAAVATTTASRRVTDRPIARPIRPTSVTDFGHPCSSAGLRRTPLDRDPANLKEKAAAPAAFFASALQLRRVTIFDEILYKLCHRRLYSIVQ